MSAQNSIEQLYEQGHYLQALPLAEQWCAELTATQPEYPPALYRLAELYRQLAMYSQAENQFITVLGIQSSQLGREHADYARSLLAFGRLHEETARYTSAERMIEQALSIQRKNYGESHPDIAESVYALALLRESQGRLKDAEQLANDALSQRKQLFGERHRAVADSLELIARLTGERGRHSTAEELAQEVLRLRQAVQGERHPDTAGAFAVLAAHLGYRGETKPALDYIERAQPIFTEYLGTEHPFYAHALSLRAGVIGWQGDYDAAESLIRESLEVRERVQGKKHPSYANSLMTLAWVYRVRQQTDKAEETVQEALGIFEAALGKSHYQYAECLAELGALQNILLRQEEAEANLRVALATLREAFGNQHQSVASVLLDLSWSVLAREEFAEAEEYTREAIAITSALFGPTHPEVGRAWENLATLFQAMNQPEQAEPIYEQVLEAARQIWGEAHVNYIEILRKRAGILLQLGKLPEVERDYLQLCKLVKQVHGERHSEYGRALLDLALLYQQLERFEEAEKQFQLALEAYRISDTEESLEYTEVLLGMGRMYHAADNLQAAELRLRRALELRLRLAGDEPSIEVAEVLSALGSLFLSSSRGPEAEACYTQVLDIRNQTLGERAVETAMTRHHLGILYQAMSRYADAAPHFEAARSILTEQLGAEHPETIRVRHGQARFLQARGELLAAEREFREIAAAYRAQPLMQTLLAAVVQDSALLAMQMGHYVAAERYLAEVLSIQEQLYPAGHPALAENLLHRIQLYRESGSLGQALQLCEQLLELANQRGGPESPEVAWVRGLLGSLYQMRQDHERARDCFQSALRIQSSILGRNHITTLETQSNLATSLYFLGRVGDALNMRLEIVQTALKAHGPNSAIYLQSTDALALLYQALGRPQDAEPLLKNGLDIVRRAVDDTSPLLATSLTRLGELCRYNQRSDEALQYYRQAAQLLERNFGEQHRSLSGSLNQQVMIYLERGDWATALPLLESLLSVDREHLGEHPDVAMSLHHQAIVQLIQHNNDSALIALREANELMSRLLPDLIRVPVERQRMLYLQAAYDQLHTFLSLHDTQSSTELACQAYELVRTRKALWVEAAAADRVGVYLRRHPELHDRYHEWSMWRRQIALRLANGPGLERRELHQQWLDQWQTHRQDIEEELRPHTPEMGLERPRFNGGESSEPLGVDGLVIEWVRTTHMQYADYFSNERAVKFPVEYHAFIVEGQTGNVRAWVNLGKASAIDNAVLDWEKQGYDTDADAVVRELVWEPLRPHLASTNQYWLISDGALVRVPLHQFVTGATVRNCLSLTEAQRSLPRADGPTVAVATEPVGRSWWQRLFQRQPGGVSFSPLVATQVRPGKLNQLVRPAVVLFDMEMFGTGEAGVRQPTTTVPVGTPVRWTNPLETCGLRGDRGIVVTAKQLSGLDLVGSVVILPKLGDATGSGMIGIVRALFLSGASAVVIPTRRVSADEVGGLIASLEKGHTLTECLKNAAPFLVYERGTAS